MLWNIVVSFLRHFDDRIYDMATIKRRGEGWQVQICVQGVRRSGTFSTKREASAWSAAQTLEIQSIKAGGIPNVPLSRLFERYSKEVSPTKRGKDHEIIRLRYFLRDALASIPLPKLGAADFAAWRDRRMREVSAGTVLRDWTLLNHVFTVAVRDWDMLPVNPMRGVRKPKTPLSRDRTISEDEIERILYAAGYSRVDTPQTITARVGAAFLFAIETGMRAGEIVALTWDCLKGSVAFLPMTKNGFPRHVPLSVEALRILDQLPRAGHAGGSVFDLKTSQIDALFRKIRGRCMIENLHFHDTRHEAITRLARKLDVLDLARMVGIRDLKILLVYYNAKPEDIAARLD
jgi:integrase